MQSSPLRNRFQTARIVPLRRFRFWLVCGLFLLWALVITCRLFWLQVVRHQEFYTRAQHQQQHTFEVAPRRGVLYDRNLHELAMTVQVDSIYADPSQVTDKHQMAWQLARLVHTDPDDQQTSLEQIEQRLNNGRNFAWIARRVRPEVATSVRSLNLKGIFFQKEFQRFYPDRTLAAQVLGYVGLDDNGLGGLEEKFDSQLHGAPGQVYAAMDARRKVLGSSESDPRPGRSMILTLDENIQFQAEQALQHAMESSDADNGTIVVQDVHNGQILALAIRPTFNPNQFRHTTPSLLRDHAVSDVYEPGSTFKLVTYSAALDQQVVHPDDTIDCQGSVIKVGPRTIHDDKGDHFNRIAVHEALEHSSNVAAIKLGQMVGASRMNQYMRGFGFGSKSGIELPGETRGLLQPEKRWTLSSLASMSMGQEVAVTPIQLATMVSTIANGGVYMPPHILMPAQPPAVDQNQKSSTTLNMAASPVRPGEDLPNPMPTGGRRVISTLTAAQMRKMLEGVVLYGTGKSAQLNGYSSGGKTGTAQKIDPATHHYSKTMHVASFAGFAPVNNPMIAVAVILDNPKKGYYGAAVSAPVFAEVAQQVLEYLGVPHDTQLHAVRKPTTADLREDDGDQGADESSLMAAVNDLPTDDPLRSPGGAKSAANTAAAAQKAYSTPLSKPTGLVPVAQQSKLSTPATTQPAPKQSTTVPLNNNAHHVRVPTLTGLPVRKVIEQASGAGLEVQVVGFGLCKQQSPEAGAMVAPGTHVVVHCGR